MKETLVHQLPSALEYFEEIQKRISGKQLVLFLDYDGTLTPIVSHPEDAYLAPEAREILLRLSFQYPMAIISGRDLEDVKKHVGIPNIYYAGSHGFDISGPQGLKSEFYEAVKILPHLKEAGNALQAAIFEYEGAHIEKKRFSIAVHYRNVDEAKKASLKAKIKDIGTSFPDLRLVNGKQVLDFRPDVDWDKGKALLWLRERMSLRHPVVSCYIGDDITDEDAFKILNETEIGIAVGNGLQKAHAGYQLKDTQEVQEFLERLSRI